jgi:hypothetical protein
LDIIFEKLEEKKGLLYDAHNLLKIKNYSLDIEIKNFIMNNKNTENIENNESIEISNKNPILKNIKSENNFNRSDNNLDKSENNFNRSDNNLNKSENNLKSQISKNEEKEEIKKIKSMNNFGEEILNINDKIIKNNIDIYNIIFEKTNIKKLLEKSYSLITENFGVNYLYLINSNKNINEILNIFNNEKINPKKQNVQLLNYFENILFNFDHFSKFRDESEETSKEMIEENEENIGNEILFFYFKNCSNKLSEIIINSNVKKYSKLFSIKLLENLINENEFFINPKDKFVLGLLYYDIGETETTLKIFNEIGSNILIEFFTMYHKNLLFYESKIGEYYNDENVIQNFEFFLFKHFPCIFLEILVRINNFNYLAWFESEKNYKLLFDFYLSFVLLSNKLDEELFKKLVYSFLLDLESFENDEYEERFMFLQKNLKELGNFLFL